MARRQVNKPILKRPFWVQVEGKYRADKEALLKAIKDSGRTERDIRKRMGRGFEHLQELLEGKSVDGYAGQLVEWGLVTEAELAKLPRQHSI